ncbi:hypothetical protein Moror_4147 [Moniliophthora roreri MCA 2997]|uniref:F-box domain-containing protein n=1 Tax=Moniliophthora roreri (strain MCA 2997) TaxID=1381753 RepID=V2WV22_MONRO|nr:hypothetical protein Moror_4147 [Moniliophthora roreri MCA 2997]
MCLSQEVIDIIIDEIAGDRRSLLNLALASRILLPRARQYLFHELYLLPTHRNDRPSALRISTWVDAHIKKLIELCSHPQSTIPRSGPKRIHLAPCGKDHPRISRKDDNQAHSAFIELLSWLTSRSPLPSGKHINRKTRTNSNATWGEHLFWNVRELNISWISPAHGLTELKNLLLVSPFPRVTRLLLDDVDFRSRKCFSDILSAFHSLEYLSAGVSFDRIPITKRPVSFPISLRHIEIPRISYELLPKSSLQTLETCATIKYLTFPVHIRTEPQFAIINQFLDTSVALKSGVLRQCNIVLDGVWVNQPAIPTSWSRKINFHKVPEWTFDANLRVFYGLAADSDNDRTVIPNVTRVILSHWVEPRLIDLKMYQDADEVLSDSTRFPGLREIELTIEKWFKPQVLGSSEWDGRSQTVREGSAAHMCMEALAEKAGVALPKCRDRGLLKIKYRYRWLLIF